MIASAWLFLGLVATLLTAGVVLVPDEGWAIVLGVAGFVTWAMVAYGAFDVTVIRDTTHHYQMPVVALFAVMMACIPGYIALTGPANLMDTFRSADASDV